MARIHELALRRKARAWPEGKFTHLLMRVHAKQQTMQPFLWKLEDPAEKVLAASLLDMSVAAGGCRHGGTAEPALS